MSESMQAPEKNGLAAPYLAGLAAGRLKYQCCADCGAALTMARYACTQCGGWSLSWAESSGLGEVVAATTIHRPPSQEYAGRVPYTILLVKLDEGFQIMAHGSELTSPGSRVRFVPHEWMGRPLARFEPA